MIPGVTCLEIPTHFVDLALRRLFGRRAGRVLLEWSSGGGDGAGRGKGWHDA